MAGWKRAVSFTAIILGFFMALLDTTIVNVALPEMTKHFGASMDGMSWVVNGYNLAFAVFLVSASRLADQFGRKRLFLIGVCLFVISSILAGLSTSLPMLIAFRVIQGLAGAIVVPITIPMSIGIFSPKMEGAVIGIWGGISGLAAASGPTLGGILTDSIGWSSIFFVNIPIGAVCLLLSWIMLKESKDPTAGRVVDWPGIGLLSAALFCLTYALIKANDWGWGSAALTLMMGGSLFFFVLFVWVERKIKEPMLPLGMFRIRTFNWGALTLLMTGAGIMAASFLMSYYLTSVMGKTVLAAGMTISAMPLASMVASAIAGPLSNRFGGRYFSAAGMLVMSGGVYSFGALHPGSQQLEVLWRLAMCGVGFGLVMAPTMGAVMRNVPPEKTGIASGITNMTRALGSVLGVALLVTLLNSQLTDHLAEAKRGLADAIRQENRITPEIRELLALRLQEQQVSKGQNADFAAALEKLNAELASRKEQALASFPPEGRDAASKGWDNQLEAVRNWASDIGPAMKEASSDAFRTTFHAAGLTLILGAWFGLWSDRKRRRAQNSGKGEWLPEQA